MTVGANSKDYRALTATVTDRLVNTPSGRLVRDKTITNLSDVDLGKQTSGY